MSKEHSASDEVISVVEDPFKHQGKTFLYHKNPSTATLKYVDHREGEK